MSHTDSLVLQTAGVNDVWHYNEIHLDSSQRDAGSNDNPRFTLAEPLHDVMGIKVISAQIPFSYYLIDEHNNAFEFTYSWRKLTGFHTTETKRFTFDVGNYSAEELALQWQTKINQNNPGFGSHRVRFLFNRGIFQITNMNGDTEVADEHSYGYTFRFPDDQETAAELFGCVPGQVYGAISDDETGPSNVYTGVCNTSGPNYITIISNLANVTNNNLHVNGLSTPTPPVIARIPVTVGPFDMITYGDVNAGFAFDASLAQIQNIELGLRLGTHDHPLSLNGQSWSVVLMVLTQRQTTSGRHVYPEGSGNKRIRVR